MVFEKGLTSCKRKGSLIVKLSTKIQDYIMSCIIIGYTNQSAWISTYQGKGKRIYLALT
jgi:hypothetical protein